jgi:hypothetical protein
MVGEKRVGAGVAFFQCITGIVPSRIVRDTGVHSRIVRCSIAQNRACSMITVLYRIAVTHTVTVISLDFTSPNNLL